MGVGGQRHAPADLPPGKTRCPLYGKLDRLQGRSGQVRKISSSPELDPRTVQPVASSYTDWASPVLCLTGQVMVECLTDCCQIDWPNDWLTPWRTAVRLTDRMIDWLPDGLLSDCLTKWLIDCLTDCCQIDWPNDWLTSWRIAVRLTDRMIDWHPDGLLWNWLFDGMIDWLLIRLTQGSAISPVISLIGCISILATV